MSRLIPTKAQLMVNRNVMTVGCTIAGFYSFDSYPVVSRMDPALGSVLLYTYSTHTLHIALDIGQMFLTISCLAHQV